LVESHYTLTYFQYTLSTATEGQDVCLLLQWVLVGRTKFKNKNLVRGGGEQFTHWLKCAISLTGINLYKKHPELADLEDSTKFHDNMYVDM
jgi:hypothetical protein